jgi:hypothetical protein
MRARNLLFAIFPLLPAGVLAQAGALVARVDVDSITLTQNIYPTKQGAGSQSGARLRIPVRKIRVATRSTLTSGELASVVAMAEGVGFLGLPDDLARHKDWCSPPPDDIPARTTVTLHWASGQKSVDRPDGCAPHGDPATSAFKAYRAFEDRVLSLTRPVAVRTRRGTP